MVLGAVLTALVIILEVISASLGKAGMFRFTFSLVPIAIGAAMRRSSQCLARLRFRAQRSFNRRCGGILSGKPFGNYHYRIGKRYSLRICGRPYL